MQPFLYCLQCQDVSYSCWRGYSSQSSCFYSYLRVLLYRQRTQGAKPRSVDKCWHLSWLCRQHGSRYASSEPTHTHTRAMARVKRAQRTSLYRRMHAQVTSPCDTLPDKRIGRATSVLFSLSVFHLNRKVREVAHECPRSRRCARRASPPGGVFHASLHGGVVAESVPHEGMFHVVWTPLPSESCVMRWLRMRPTNQMQPLWIVSRPPCDWPRPGHDIGRPIKARLISISGAGPLMIKASCAPRQSTPRTNIYGHDPAARHCPCQGV